MAGGRKIDPRARDRLQVYQCWSEVNVSFHELVRDFGRCVKDAAIRGRDARSLWAQRYGWDAIPMQQFPEARLDREHLGPWRWRLLRVRMACRLDEEDVLSRSGVLSILAEVVPMLDRLRVGLTGHVRVLCGHEPRAELGGELLLAKDIQRRLARARRLIRRMFHGRLPTAPRTGP